MARELIGRTGVSAKPGGATRGRVSPTQVSALRVLTARTDRDGQCWLQVRLPTRPNVAKGWVAADRVQLTPTAWRIEVALRARMVTLLRGGERVARYRAVVGAPSTPTPRGLFALMDAHPNDPGDFLGLGADPDRAQQCAPALRRPRGAPRARWREPARPLGSAASHGCVRVTNAAIASIVRRIGAPAMPSTPVMIGA